MGFERCHPAVKLLFFTVVLALTLVCRHWVYLLLSPATMSVPFVRLLVSQR